ncbi:hypothetical protein ABS858_10880 [Vibrio neptunius]|uniref:hypothetical protein n=1 Tax=Vibrio neptunius TaxID=170651 RepID=UPI003314FC4A
MAVIHSNQLDKHRRFTGELLVLIASDAVFKQLKNTLNLAWKTNANHLRKIQRLYEQGGSPECIEGYASRWLR